MQQRSEETQARILDAAVRRFSISGYNGASVDDICSDAGVSKGAFYHHFPTKQAVFMTLLNTYLGSLDSGFEEMRLEIKNVPQALLQMAEMAGSIFQSSDFHLPIFLEFWAQSRHDPQVWTATMEPFRRYQDYFTRMIQEGIDEGTLQPVDAQLAARVIVSLAVGLLMESLFDPNITDWQLEAKQSIQLMLNGLARRNV